MAVVSSPVSAVTNLGQVNDLGSTEAIFLKVASGQVLSMYEETNVTGSRIMMREMPRGAKSLQFPGVGQAFTKHQLAGANILTDTADAANDTPSSTGAATFYLSNVNMGEREVFIDDPLESSVFIDRWEEFKSSFDASPPLMRELGKVLAVDNDKYVLRLIVKGTRTIAISGIDWSATSIPTEFAPADGAQNFIDANAGTDGSVLLDQIRQVQERWDNTDIPEESRYCALAPQHYNLLVQNQDLLNRDFGGQNGIFADGTVFKAWGIELLKSTHIPTLDFSADANPGWRNSANLYAPNATGTIACCWQQEGIAGVRAGSVSMEKGYLIQYRGTLLVASLSSGYDILRPLNLARIGTT